MIKCIIVFKQRGLGDVRSWRHSVNRFQTAAVDLYLNSKYRLGRFRADIGHERWNLEGSGFDEAVKRRIILRDLCCIILRTQTVSGTKKVVSTSEDKARQACLPSLTRKIIR